MSDMKKNWDTIMSAMRNDSVNIPSLLNTKLLREYLMHCFSLNSNDANIFIEEADRLAKHAHRFIGDSKQVFMQKYDAIANSIIKENGLSPNNPGNVHVVAGITFLMLCNYYSAGSHCFQAMVEKMKLTGNFKKAIVGLYKLL
ncbi:hypothetical protein [Petroclostridium sp. X23]|uniref:hypothetical protein n=1 Tax=Petroclostridium sp. X23 TaxID=3045146 RepID=UPI0024AD2E6B|nr:hypothetical protein [Petroclostridium sp. X23]WHH57182.1 hypothetical protein QKW49_15195 [Petroclostridium sp. X23]